MSDGVRLKRVEAQGLAQRAGLRAGDVLLAINGHGVGDQIDVQFYSSARRLRLTWRNDSAVCEATVVRRQDESFAWEFEQFLPRRCANRCPFCFVFQLPPGLRKPLYFRDEDYRLSFLYGHYITGTNLTAGDLERIVRQRLSPLYVSVHATDPALRARMLGRRESAVPPVRQLLDFFSQHDIRFHAQIVVCPGWNDGSALIRTLADLRAYYPALLSVAIVPVGLTAHRAHLPPIRRVTSRYAARLIDALHPIVGQWRRELGRQVFFLADEWYLRAGRSAPEYGGIDMTPQFENGVGMVGHFMRPWKAIARRLPRKLPRQRTIISPSARGCRDVVVVTGVSAAMFLRPVIGRLNAIEGLRVRLIVVRNRLFGPTVTVSGLLAGRDILAVLLARRRADLYLLPANCLRPWDKILIDDLPLDHLSARLDRPVVPVEGTCRDLVRAAMEAER
ncbi:DUF512 domain-containing protein [Candidatus Sumerlaeota bacterium]|nr:DUF512 domain-containing protein [Candidatus Sumerlaeota bacterium]